MLSEISHPEKAVSKFYRLPLALAQKLTRRDSILNSRTQTGGKPFFKFGVGTQNFGRPPIDGRQNLDWRAWRVCYEVVGLSYW
jgi:hypothetical protein